MHQPCPVTGHLSSAITFCRFLLFTVFLRPRSPTPFRLSLAVHPKHPTFLLLFSANQFNMQPTSQPLYYQARFSPPSPSPRLTGVLKASLLGSHAWQERKVEKALTSLSFSGGVVTRICIEFVDRTSTTIYREDPSVGCIRGILSSAADGDDGDGT